MVALINQDGEQIRKGCQAGGTDQGPHDRKRIEPTGPQAAPPCREAQDPSDNDQPEDNRQDRDDEALQGVPANRQCQLGDSR